MTETRSNRTRYVPDYRMRWSRLPVLLLVPVTVAVVAGFLMNLLFHVGWYLIILVPCLAAAIVCASIWCCIRWSQCRMPLLAAILGLAAGTAAYLSSFYFDMVVSVGPQVASRVDLLPDYIGFRMANDVHEEVGRANPQQKAPKADQFRNWMTFGFEILIIIGITVTTGYQTAARPFDQETGRWMHAESVQLIRGAHEELRRALENGDFEQFLSRYQPVNAAQSANNTNLCTVTLEYAVLASDSPLERPVYLTAEEVSLRTAVSGMLNRSGRLSRIELSGLEALKLQPLFPEFAQKVQSCHQQLAALSEESASQVSDSSDDASG